MDKLALLKEFERIHAENDPKEECEWGCECCDYLDACDTLEQVLKRKKESEEYKE